MPVSVVRGVSKVIFCISSKITESAGRVARRGRSDSWQSFKAAKVAIWRRVREELGVGRCKFLVVITIVRR
jgi:hypothetical protein